MALYHFHVDQVKRSEGRSAVASVAYRAGEKLHNLWDGETHDYTKKGGVVFTEIMLPPNAPERFSDRSTLWNDLEQFEKRGDAQLAYSFDVAMQNEFTMEENIEYARQFVREQFLSVGMIADFAFHLPGKDENDIPNPHFHVLVPIRPLNEDGTWGAKQHRVYNLDENGQHIKKENGQWDFIATPTTDWGKPETLQKWREEWAKFINSKFEEKGLDCRIDHRSYVDQGLDILPTVHEGPQVRKMEKRGMRKFLKFVHDDNVYCKYYEAVYILFHTGMRISEFCGLTLKDIDLENRIINIDHQLQRLPDMRLIIESTKTNAGTRKLPMTDDVFQCFLAIIEDRPKRKHEKMVEGYTGFLYTDEEGNPFVAMHWQHRFNHMVKRYNDIYRVQMPNITPHICRHTYCSNMAKSGMNPKTLQYLMGHSDIGVTMNTCTHLGLEDATDELRRVQELEDPRKEQEKLKGTKPAVQKMFRVV